MRAKAHNYLSIAFLVMPFTLTHGLISYLPVTLLTKEKKLWLIAIISGMLPDLDGIPILYDRALYYRVHHELFHPPVYGVLLGVIAVYAFEHFFKMKKLPVFSVTAFSFSLHAIADVVFTNWYVKLLWPISSYKFTYPVLLDYSPHLVFVVYSLLVLHLLFSDLKGILTRIIS